MKQLIEFALEVCVADPRRHRHGRGRLKLGAACRRVPGAELNRGFLPAEAPAGRGRKG